MGKSEEPLCFCFNIHKTDIDEYFSSGTKTYDMLVSDTKIGTKCTACLGNLDVHLDNIIQNKQITDKTENIAFEKSEIGISAFKTFTDSGFCLPTKLAKTIVSLQNYDQIFSEANKCIDFTYQILVFSETGKLVTNTKGKLRRNSGINIDASKNLSSEENGWFILKLRGLEDGYFGTMRPQVLFHGNKWSASYHTQPHYMATTEGYRSTVSVKYSDTSCNAFVNVINASRKQNEILFKLVDHSGNIISSTTELLVGSGCITKEVTKLFEDDNKDGIFKVVTSSKFPTRKHILNKLSDGSFSVDHFPN